MVDSSAGAQPPRRRTRDQTGMRDSTITTTDHAYPAAAQAPNGRGPLSAAVQPQRWDGRPAELFSHPGARKNRLPTTPGAGKGGGIQTQGERPNDERVVVVVLGGSGTEQSGAGDTGNDPRQRLVCWVAWPSAWPYRHPTGMCAAQSWGTGRLDEGDRRASNKGLSQPGRARRQPEGGSGVRSARLGV